MWELDISRDGGATYQTVAKKPSAEACKSYARSLHRSRTSVNPNILYRLYAAGGNCLQYVSGDNRSWRMTWGPGNLKPRQEQAGQHSDETAKGVAA